MGDGRVRLDLSAGEAGLVIRALVQALALRGGKEDVGAMEDVLALMPSQVMEDYLEKQLARGKAEAYT